MKDSKRNYDIIAQIEFDEIREMKLGELSKKIEKSRSVNNILLYQFIELLEGEEYIKYFSLFDQVEDIIDYIKIKNKKLLDIDIVQDAIEKSISMNTILNTFDLAVNIVFRRVMVLKQKTREMVYNRYLARCKKKGK